MKVVFFLKGAVRLDWQVPQPVDTFNFQIMVKMIRADGQFLADGVYIQANEIAAILLDRELQLPDQVDKGQPNVAVQHKGKVQRLQS